MGANHETNGRVAIVAGLRTPFTKQGTALRALRSVDLGTVVVRELVERTELDPKELGVVIYGQVVPSVDWLNIAREVVLRAGLPKSIEAYSVTRACATSIQALTNLAESIAVGHHSVGIAGGADSMSDIPLAVSRPLTDALLALQKAKTFPARLQAFSKVTAKDILPPTPGFSVEPTTGESMGQAAEKMAKLNGISREAQDALAHASHTNAAKAWKLGYCASEVMPVFPPPFDKPIDKDNLVRDDSTLASYGKLSPAFDRKHGTITPGNASPLTDGASALLVMREDRAKALGYKPLGYLKSWAYAAVDPSWQLLQGPVFAVPKALERAGLGLSDMTIIEMHEAFAAQVLSNIQALGSKKFCEQHMGLGAAVGEVDPAKLNVNGGSIAFGHPFAATGGRIVTSALNELNRRGGGHALITICAAGGLGVAVVLEAA